ncbi:anthranilate phosphoribosyltransferase [Campylobacter sp. 19-13652]|uniref:anthranilate phosphoribosyltransferase n=1 Tax=Campylobacter sp. 19-13652 TaxID=2840180 RepID=UPI001C759A68|nr:anthranilate phosphoribosyltransferase [Campylobacter sp. 19-13652]BCX78657.1 anthranilate phosphoribosyltransferase [Campylobacter sp. 19-13652]
MILIIDNYDSFVFNIYQYVQQLSTDEVLCVRNDQISLEQIKDLSPSHIILSPGPKHPKDSGVCLDVLGAGLEAPVLGVCLGHQAIGLNYGASIKRQDVPLHGKTSKISTVNGGGEIFAGLPDKFEVMRYHSLYVDDLPQNLTPLAYADDGVLMALKVKDKDIYGIQFHPESYFSEYGKQIIANFLNISKKDEKKSQPHPTDLRPYLLKLQENERLDDRDFAGIIDLIASSKADELQLAALLVLISEKSLNADSLVSLVRNILRYSHTFRDSSAMIDLCGTGGDGFKSINVSTAVSFILAALGVKVAKHGNKAVSSASGSSDVISAINLKISDSIAAQRMLLDSANLAFFHAPFFHPLVGALKDVRTRLGIRTVFNILGPMLNPNLSLRYQLVGCYHKPVLRLYAQTLGLLGRKHALVVRGEDGMDEISICDSTRIVELKDGTISEYSVTPEQFGFTRALHSDIAGADAAKNAEILKATLKGELNGAKRDIVVLNAMFALYTADRVSSPNDAREIVESALDSGLVWEYFMHYLKGLGVEA